MSVGKPGLNWSGSGGLTCKCSSCTRAGVVVLPDGSPSLVLSDAAGKRAASLSMRSDGTPGLALSDAAGKPRANLYLLPDGSPDLALYDAAGKTRAIMSLTKDNAPYLGLGDKNGILRAILGAARLTAAKTEEVTIRPESSLVLFDKDGKVIWEAP